MPIVQTIDLNGFAQYVIELSLAKLRRNPDELPTTVINLSAAVSAQLRCNTSAKPASEYFECDGYS